MRILLDNNAPEPLRYFLKGHDVVTTREKGWQAVENGYLLAAAEREGFELLITCDQNLRYQQKLQGRTLMILILLSNHWPSIRKVVARITTTIDFMQTGQVREVEIFD